MYIKDPMLCCIEFYTKSHFMKNIILPFLNVLLLTRLKKQFINVINVIPNKSLQFKQHISQLETDAFFSL